MKFDSKGKVIALTALALVVSACVQPQRASAAPEPTLHSEALAHPRIVKAIHELREALRELEAAPDNFGGNKQAAIEDTRRAIHSLKKALYYRLHMDDAALDRAEVE